MRDEIKKLVKEVMEENHLSVHRMAEAIGVSHQTLYNWLSGEEIPRLNTIRRIRSIGGWQGDFAFQLSLILISE
jgi:transcriptional regulator with XRE-family HTH domain